MSIPNENLNSEESKHESITIDETGNVVINDPELEKISDNLSPEELDSIAAGNNTVYGCGVNVVAHCGGYTEVM
jgi:hypothetical protein